MLRVNTQAAFDPDDYIACLPGGACLVRPAHAVAFAWLLALLAVAEFAYLLNK